MTHAIVKKLVRGAEIDLTSWDIHSEESDLRARGWDIDRMGRWAVFAVPISRKAKKQEPGGGFVTRSPMSSLVRTYYDESEVKKHIENCYRFDRNYRHITIEVSFDNDGDSTIHRILQAKIVAIREVVSADARNQVWQGSG